MNRNLLPWQILTAVLLLVPSLYLAYAWPILPAQVPTHFDLNGTANGYTSRSHMWLLTLGLPLAVALLFSALPRLDPKRRLDSGSVNFQKLRLVTVALLGGTACYCLHAALHPGSGTGRGITVLVGVFLAFVGNYLTTVPPNYFVGIRTPWTLESPRVWARTHRVGGILFCVAGLVLAGLALVLPLPSIKPVFLTLVLGTAAFTYGFSFYAYRHQNTLGETAP